MLPVLSDNVKGIEQKIIMMRMRSWALIVYFVGFPADEIFDHAC